MNKELISFLSNESGLLESEIYDFLEMLNAPENLKSLLVVLNNIVKINSFSNEISPFLSQIYAQRFPDTTFLNSLQSALNKGVPELEELSSLECTRHGIQNTHPEYAMLLMGLDDPLFENNKFRMLQGILLYCSFEQRHRLKTGRIKSIKFEIQSACRYLRQFETGINNDLNNLTLPQNNWDLLKFYKSNLVISISENFKKYFSSLILKIHHYRGGKSRVGYKRVIAKSSIKKIILKDPDENQEGAKNLDFFTELLNVNNSIDDERAEGAHPEEFSEIKGVKASYSDKEPMLGFSASQHFKRQRSQIDHIAVNNQLLPFRYGFLTDFELNEFGSEIKLLENKDKLLALSIRLSLLFGKSLRQALSIKIYNSIDQSLTFKGDEIYYSLEDDCFWIQIPEPEWKSKQSASSKVFMFQNFDGLNRSDSQRLQLSLPDTLKTQLKELKLNGLSNIKIKELEEKYLTFLKAVNRKYGIRLTQQRISDLLFNYILKGTSDLVPAYLLTKKSHTTAEVGSHYSSFEGHKLSRIFFKAACDLHDVLGLVSEKKKLKETYLTDNLLFGSHLYFKEKHLKALQEHLYSELKDTFIYADLRKIHNALVLYLIFWLKFTLGLRAVNDLLFSEKQIDWSSGLVVITDKETGAGHSRVAWLTPKVRAQLNVYQHHLEKVIPSFSESIKLPKVHGFLFFIDDKGRYKPITPSRIIDLFPAWKLKNNINRHYLRSRLSDFSCPGELIDGFMGHWELGQSPFNKFSSLSPFSFVDQLKPFISKVEFEAGWEVISV